MSKKKNRNIVLLKNIKELRKEIDFANFEYRDNFEHICDLIPDKENERLNIEPIDVEKTEIKEGMVYVFVINNKIFKIGHTITSFKKRIQSYNCGKTEYRISGTNSTTNYFVLQSLLNMNKRVKIYAFFPKQPTYELFGNEYKDSFPPSKRAENIILNEFLVKHKKKPIGCTQR